MQTLSSVAMGILNSIVLEEIQKIVDALCSGTVQNMEEYKRLTGRLSALREFPNFVEEAYNRAEGKS